MGGEYFKPEELKTEKEIAEDKKAKQPKKTKKENAEVSNGEADLINYDNLDVDAKLNHNVDQILDVIKGIEDPEIQDQAVHQVIQNIVINGTSDNGFERMLGKLDLTKQKIINNYFAEDVGDLEG